jgi:hypothetical protein
MSKVNFFITSIKMDKSLPNKIQLANVYYEQKKGSKRTVYEFINEAIAAKLKEEGIR